MRIRRLWSDTRLRTLLVVNLASIMEKADEALLPSVYREIGNALHASPTALGSLTLLRSLTQAVCFPLAAFLALHHDRARVIALGAFMWAVATLCVGISSTFFQVAVSRALNGVGLAIVVPAIQSLVADASSGSNRGEAFGWLHFTGTLGSILGGLLAILLASTSFVGIAGWRLSFLLVAFISILVGILVYTSAVDPRDLAEGKKLKQSRPGNNMSALWTDVKELVLEARQVMKIPTFQILLAQGVVGTFPWAALAFAAMWLELTGFSNNQTALLLGTFAVASGIGGLFGGKLGDICARYSPNAGRILLAQFSACSGVPLAAILVLAVPTKPDAIVIHGALFFALGFFTSWNAPATNNPIFAEIVPEKARTNIYALDRAVESVLASFAPPIVGFLAEKLYGFVQAPPGSDKADAVKVDREDAQSLGKALYTVYSIPLALCALIYFLLYWTYPRDRDRVQHEELEIASEDGHVRLRVVNYQPEDYNAVLDSEDSDDEKQQSERDQLNQRSTQNADSLTES